MGIRANALTDHKVPDYRDHEAVIALLAPALPATRAVAAYWRAVQADYSDTEDAWSARSIQNPPEQDYLRYDGPGGLSVSFGERVAQISGPCRWSGFCTMAALHQAHVIAFRSIARSLGGECMVLMPDYDPVEAMALYDGCGLDECIRLLNQHWGVPQLVAGILTEDAVEYLRRKDPAWFLEGLTRDA